MVFHLLSFSNSGRTTNSPSLSKNGSPSSLHFSRMNLQISALICLKACRSFFIVSPRSFTGSLSFFQLLVYYLLSLRFSQVYKPHAFDPKGCLAHCTIDIEALEHICTKSMIELPLKHTYEEIASDLEVVLMPLLKFLHSLIPALRILEIRTISIVRSALVLASI